jgi:general transcription factor 3C polypeptide 6
MSSDERLAPGFRQVDGFGSDDIYERDENGEVIEEVSYVTLDLGAVEPTLVPSTSTYRLIVRRNTLSQKARPN